MARWQMNIRLPESKLRIIRERATRDGLTVGAFARRVLLLRLRAEGRDRSARDPSIGPILPNEAEANDPPCTCVSVKVWFDAVDRLRIEAVAQRSDLSASHWARKILMNVLISEASSAGASRSTSIDLERG